MQNDTYGHDEAMRDLAELLDITQSVAVEYTNCEPWIERVATYIAATEDSLASMTQNRDLLIELNSLATPSDDAVREAVVDAARRMRDEREAMMDADRERRLAIRDPKADHNERAIAAGIVMEHEDAMEAARDEMFAALATLDSGA